MASALAFFGSILLHEMGHAVVALREGIGITDITLWLFGGVARMSRDTESPGAEWRIAVAGPVVTLAIAAACLGLGFALGGVRVRRGAAASRSRPTPPERSRCSPGWRRSTS